MVINRQLIGQKIFLIDGLGALATALCLGVLLPKFNVGLETAHLYLLAILATLFSIYSTSCYLVQVKPRSNFLMAIIFANLLYCIITSLIIVTNYGSLSILGWLYFITEIIVIFILCTIEVKVLRGTF